MKWFHFFAIGTDCNGHVYLSNSEWGRAYKKYYSDFCLLVQSDYCLVVTPRSLRDSGVSEEYIASIFRVE
jgi:hypothetical protein